MSTARESFIERETETAYRASADAVESVTEQQAEAMQADRDSARRVSAEHRIPSLDGIRALSIGVVLLGHFTRYPDETRAGQLLSSLAHTGVLIFFVISGYLITQLLMAERERTGTISLKDFYVRRAFRILPAAYVSMACIMLFIERDITPVHKIAAIFFLQDFVRHPQMVLGHLWSLGVEEQFYFLWPLVTVYAFRKRFHILLTIIALVPIINLLIIHRGWGLWGQAFYSVADSLAVGCLMALVRRRESVQRFVDSRYFLLTLLPFTFAVLTNPVHFGIFLSLCKSLVFRPFINVGIALMIEYFVRHPPFLLNCSPVRWVGRLSYSLYLWQQPFARMPGVSLLEGLTIALLCAIGSYYFIELPFLRLRRRLVSNGLRGFLRTPKKLDG